MVAGRVFRTFRGYQLIEQEKAATLTPSMEDYLEMIYRRSIEDEALRVNQLADQLNVQAPSVTRILGRLSALGYIKHHRYGLIELTDKGRKQGKFLLDRHRSVEAFLTALGIDTAFEDAELIEHHITGETLTSLELWLAFFESNPDILIRFREFRTRLEDAGEEEKETTGKR